MMPDELERLSHDGDPAADHMEVTTFQVDPPPHLATENMMDHNASLCQQQDSGPFTKRSRIGATPPRKKLEDKINYETGTLSESAIANHAIENSRSTGEGSVTVRRELLDEFGKQNKNHYEKTAHIGRQPDGVVLTKPVRPKCQAAPHPTTQRPPAPNSSSTTKMVKKPVSNDHHHHHHHPPQQQQQHHAPHNAHHQHHHHPVYRGPELTPVRIKPRFKKEDVEATNDGYAPVAKLAAWLADNPTSNKKVACVRKGANVIAKSRKFERDLENVIIEENSIEVGGVADKKQWFKTAFSEDNASEASGSLVNVSDKRKWLAHAFKREDDDDDDDHVAAETASEILSVTDKKKWLETAFKRGADGKMTKVSKATSMVNMPRNDDATTRAKKKWQENSARRLAARESITRNSFSTTTPVTTNHHHSNHDNGERSEERAATRHTEELQFLGTSHSDKREEFAQSNEHAHASDDNNMVWEAENGGAATEGAPTHSSGTGTPGRRGVEEDKTPVDFRAARELLIQRSKQNGNPLSVVSKVQRRKQIFERFEKEHKRRSGQFGLLRPSWEPVAEPIEGPTTAYKKTYVEDIVPKKSFEDLP